MLDRSLEDLTEADLIALGHQHVPESIRLEFKRQLNLESDKDKAEAAKAIKKAKALFAQKATGDAARMQDLDQALTMAYHAKSLNASPGMWDDKPDSLIGDIKAAQEKLRKKTGLAPASVATKPTNPMTTVAKASAYAAICKAHDALQARMAAAEKALDAVEALAFSKPAGRR